MKIKLNKPQLDFIHLPTKFKAFVAGFGSGKTYVGCNDMMLHYCNFPRVDQGYFAPTFPLIRDIFYPTLEEVAYNFGAKVKVRLSAHEADIYFGRWRYGTTICRTMDNPSNIVGFKIGNALVDELDVMREEKARAAWNKIIARLRWNAPGVKNGASVTTTPEGFKFTYEKFKKNATDSYGLIQASTYDNAHNLPEGYIESLVESYPEQLIKAYLNGQFVNLTSGVVYDNFDRRLNGTSETWDGKEPLHIGMDFNVGKMAAVVHVIRNNNPIAVGEISGATDTPHIIEIIKDRYRNANVRIYPDASGGGRRSVDASKSDLSMLSSAGFTVVSDKQNPYVRDRIVSMNQMFLNNAGERRYKVNIELCPDYVDALEQQVYTKSGDPDKEHDKDHPNDAAGYFITKTYPIRKPVIAPSIRMFQ